jgi:hypothetical protein
LRALSKSKNNLRLIFLPTLTKGRPRFTCQRGSTKTLPKEIFSTPRTSFPWCFIRLESIFKRSLQDGASRRMKMGKEAALRPKKRSLFPKSLRRKIEMLSNSVPKLLLLKIYLSKTSFQRLITLES